MFDAIAKPFGILLMWLYELVQNYGIAVILFAIVVKVILLPFQMKSKRGTMQQTRLQPQIAELQKKHGANKQKLNEEMQKLYREEGINPASGCLWGLIPFPILIALYQAIRYPLTIMMGVGKELVEEGGAIFTKLTELGFEATVNAAYGQIQQAQFISQPEHFNIFYQISDKLRQIDYNFFGMDLGAVPNFRFWAFDWSGGAEMWGPQVMLFLVPIVAGGLSLVQSLIMKAITPQAPTTDAAGAGSMKMMTYLMPLMSVYFAFIMPAALGIYWAAGSVLQIVQEIVLTRHYNKKMDAEAEIKNRDRAAREAEIERKREETERLKAENKTEINKSTSKKKLEAAERAEREAKAAEWAKKHAPPKEKDEAAEPSRSGTREFARGRAYDPDRYADEAIESDESAEPDEDAGLMLEEQSDTGTEDMSVAETEGTAAEGELSNGLSSTKTEAQENNEAEEAEMPEEAEEAAAGDDDDETDSADGRDEN